MDTRLLVVLGSMDGGCCPGPASHLGSMQQERPTMWYSDGREREVEELEHYGKRWNSRLEGGEKQPAMRGLGEVLAQAATEGHV